MKYKVGDIVEVSCVMNGRAEIKAIDELVGYLCHQRGFNGHSAQGDFEQNNKHNWWVRECEIIRKIDEKDYSKVTHIEYVEKKREMLRKIGDKQGSCLLANCGECPLEWHLNGEYISCREFERKYPLEAIKIVMEYKNSILDGIEKEYLLAVIKPFKNKVIYIKKNKYDDNKEYIGIYTNNCELIELPRFAPNKMYKNMQVDKNYTLKELGLE